MYKGADDDVGADCTKLTLDLSQPHPYGTQGPGNCVHAGEHRRGRGASVRQWATAVVVVFFIHVGQYGERFTTERGHSTVKNLIESTPRRRGLNALV